MSGSRIVRPVPTGGLYGKIEALCLNYEASRNIRCRDAMAIRITSLLELFDLYVQDVLNCSPFDFAEGVTDEQLEVSGLCLSAAHCIREPFQLEGMPSEPVEKIMHPTEVDALYLGVGRHVLSYPGSIPDSTETVCGIFVETIAVSDAAETAMPVTYFPVRLAQVHMI